MTAAVCGSKRSYFFDDPQPCSPPSTKKLRCGSSSPKPARSSPPQSSVFEHIKSQFPLVDAQVLEKVLAECGNDLESALKILNEISCRSVEETETVCRHAETATNNMGSENIPLCNVSANDSQWVGLFVSELMGVSTIDDAKSRVFALLENYKKTFEARNDALQEDVKVVGKENFVLKEQMQAMLQENTLLKKAVAFQYERQKGLEEKDRELHHLKKLVSQYQEQVKSLEVTNYALSMHLRQAQQSNPILGRFNPDVF